MIGCFVSNNFHTIFQYLCNTVTNYGNLCLPCNYGFHGFLNLGYKTLDCGVATEKYKGLFESTLQIQSLKTGEEILLRLRT